MRVSQQMIFANSVSSMNSTLEDLIDLNIKAQTQKRVNKPSDDPVGMARILDHRQTLSSLDQYSKNIDTAKGWLNMSDSTLTQVSTILTRAKELAEQGATGTISKDNREQISYEARQLFQQLLALANTQYENKSIYAGHKVDQPAYEETLWLTTNDANVAGSTFSVAGSSQKTYLLQFLSNGSGATTSTIGTDAVRYRYSTDGGTTFRSGSLAAGQTSITIEGVQVDFASGTQVRATAENNTNDSRGTWVWVRPTARYKGDEADHIVVNNFGSTTPASAAGVFSKNVMVRIDAGASLDQQLSYSYSVDGGVSWVTGNTVSADGTASNAVLSVPGGLLTLGASGASWSVASGAQFVIRPYTAAIEYEITQNERVRVNDVGKDIFGGVYQAASSAGQAVNSLNTRVVFSNSSMATVLFGSNAAYSKNLFEAMGNLVAFLETNNQSGVQRALASLSQAQQQVMNQAANVGGRENRLEVANTFITNLTINAKSRLSKIEDADIGELMTELAQKEIVYQAVLKTNASIMRMNLTNYL